MKKFVLAIIAGILTVCVFGASMASYIGYEVFGGSYEHLERSKILEILSRETVVYYADGQTQLGSLFGNEHRQYVALKDMPKHLLDAVVATEDESFYTHHGIDFMGTSRALLKNIFLQRREGASTITQQTVKTLYGRPVTNLRAKFVEAINAFKLERKYKKEEILEFYLNQFHVTGNGRGVGIAAKYYFDKEVQNLSLTEAAFIAASLKNPVKFNPFTKRTTEAQDKARAEGKNRKNYTLRRMLEAKFISQAQYDASKLEEVPYQQGKFQFNELFITEIVRRQLGRPEVLEALDVETVDALASMGLRITTTIEKPIQTAAQYGVRQNLSRLEMILKGFQKETSKDFVNVQRPEKFGFYVMQIKSLNKTPKTESATLSMGVLECAVPTDGIDRVARILDQALYRGLEKSKKEFMSQLSEGDYVMASIRDVNEKNEFTCDVERKPRIQGALIILDQGRIKAMVGGYSPHEYNRAVFAKRQPGSTFKSLTYYAGLQLGWDALEPLMNVRSVYSWQGQFYYPRPDHPPETSETTFVGAGSKSENLASVWLLAHLTDKLTLGQFENLLEHLKIKKPGETDDQLLGTVANTFNAKMSENNLRGGLFQSVRNEFINDISVSRSDLLRSVLRSMNYGVGFSSEMDRVVRNKGLPAFERLQRTHILKNNFMRWLDVQAAANNQLKILRAAAETGNWSAPEVRAALTSFRLIGDGQALAFISASPYEPNPIFKDKPVYSNVPAFSVKLSSIDDLVAALTAKKELLDEGGVLLDGVLPMYLVRDIESQVAERFQKLQTAPVIEKLYRHDDFRYSVGMMYASQLVENMGVESEVQWVPSFPLGANVVTLGELALAYQSIVSGKTYRYFNTKQENQLLAVQRVEDAQGQLLWEASASEHQLIDNFYSPSMLSVLRGTITNGTGYAAHNSVVLRSNDRAIDAQLVKAKIRIPVFGKTGTTNDYTNATFVGYVPYPAGEGSSELSPDHMYTVASYVGYDTNETMRRRGLKIAGGTGALPAWIEASLALIREEKYAEKLNWQKLVENRTSEIKFDYGSVPTVTVPVHNSNLLAAEIPDDDKQTTDVNNFFDDYGKRQWSQNIRVRLPGSVSDSVFRPQSRVSFFRPLPPPSQPAEFSEKPTPVGKPTLPAENLNELKYDELDLSIPPPPSESDLTFQEPPSPNTQSQTP